MNIIIKVIPHEEQRYPTAGDWWFDGEDLHVRVSKLATRWRESCIAVHELIEALLCKRAGVLQADVDAFDKKFEVDRLLGNHEPEDEAGDNAAAPYYEQHQFASGIERLLAQQLKVDWLDYEEEIESL